MSADSNRIKEDTVASDRRTTPRTKRKDNWLFEEIELAAAETESWPEWKQDIRLWHPKLAARIEATGPKGDRRNGR